MQTLLKETPSIIIENENTLILQSKDTFMSVDMQFPSKLALTFTGKQLYLLTYLQNEKLACDTKINNIFIDNIYQGSISCLIEALSVNTTKYLNCCLSKTGGGFEIKVPLFTSPIYVKFNINDDYKSPDGVPKAWEKFKEQHGVLPNILEFEPAIMKNTKIDITIEYTMKVPSNLNEDEIANIFKKEITKKNLPVKVFKGNK
jgi:hypothetical protein